MKIRRFLTAIITVYLVLGLTVTVFAQQGLILTVSPVRFELEAGRGEEITEEVELTNAGSHQVTIETDTSSFVAEGAEGKPRFVPSEPFDWSLSRWIEMEPAVFTLEPGEKKKVNVTIRVPADAEPGGHYAAVLFSSSSAGGGATAVVAKIGTLILLTVPGEIVELGSAAIAAPRVAEKGPVSLTVLFSNGGNVHIKPVGSVKVSRLWGKELVELETGGENVLPDSVRQFSTEWQDAPAVGIFVARAELRYGKAGSVAVSPAVIFVVLPWRLILAGLAIFLGGMAFNRSTGRRKRSRIEKAAV